MEYLAEYVFCSHQFFSLVIADKIIIVLSLVHRGLVLDDAANGIFLIHTAPLKQNALVLTSMNTCQYWLNWSENSFYWVTFIWVCGVLSGFDMVLSDTVCAYIYVHYSYKMNTYNSLFWAVCDIYWNARTFFGIF